MSTFVVQSIEFDKCVVDPADCKLARFSLLFERVDHASFRFETDWFALGIQRGGRWKSSFKAPMRIPCGPSKDNPMPTDQECLRISLRCVVKEEDSGSPSAPTTSSLSSKQSDTFVMQMGQTIVTASQLCLLLEGNSIHHSSSDTTSSGGGSTPSVMKVKLKGKRSYEYTVTLSSDPNYLNRHSSAVSDTSSATTVFTDDSLITSSDTKTTTTSTIDIAGGVSTSATATLDKGESSSMDGYISLLKRDLIETKKRLSQTEDSLLSVSTKYGDLLTTWKSSRGGVKKKLAEMCQMNDDLEGTMIQMKTSWNQTASILELSIEKQKGQIESLARERDSLMHSNDKYKNENRNQQQIIADLRSEKVLNERRRVEIQMKLRQKENDCLKYHNTLKEYEMKISQLQSVLVKVLKGTIEGIELESDLGLAVMPAALTSTDGDLQSVRSEPPSSSSSASAATSKHQSSSSQGSAVVGRDSQRTTTVELDDSKARESVVEVKKSKTQSLPNGDSLSVQS